MFGSGFGTGMAPIPREHRPTIGERLRARTVSSAAAVGTTLRLSPRLFFVTTSSRVTCTKVSVSGLCAPEPCGMNLKHLQNQAASCGSIAANIELYLPAGTKRESRKVFFGGLKLNIAEQSRAVVCQVIAPAKCFKKVEEQCH